MGEGAALDIVTPADVRVQGKQETQLLSFPRAARINYYELENWVASNGTDALSQNSGC